MSAMKYQKLIDNDDLSDDGKGSKQLAILLTSLPGNGCKIMPLFVIFCLFPTQSNVTVHTPEEKAFVLWPVLAAPRTEFSPTAYSGNPARQSTYRQCSRPHAQLLTDLILQNLSFKTILAPSI